MNGVSPREDTAESLCASVSDTGVNWMSIALILMMAGVFGVGYALLPSLPPTIAPDTFYNWLNFAGRVLREVLLAGIVTCLAVIASLWFPRVGLFLERLVLSSSRRRFLLVTIGFSFLSAALFAYFVMDRKTHIVDEVSMLFQAEILASGHLYAPAPPCPEFFDFEFIVVDPPRWYGKYFVGQSLFLIPGVWLGVPWLVHPVLIGICVWLTWVLALELFNEKVARIAVVLMTFSPLRLYVGGTMMGHASSLLVLLLFAVAMVKIVRQPGRWDWGIVAGSGLGFGFNARPLTALGMGAAIGAISLICMPWRKLRWPTVIAMAGSFALFVGLFLAYNKALTGDAFLTPFNKWSPNDRLGFGEDVGLEYWRSPDKGHSLRRGLLVDSYYNLDVLGSSLTGWGRVTLALLFLPLVGSTWRWRSWMLAAIWLSVAGIYILHVSSGVLMGQPRYWSEALPMMLLLIAVSLVMVRRALPWLCRCLELRPAVRTGRSAAWLTGGVFVAASLWIGHKTLIVDYCLGWTWGHPITVEDLIRSERLDHALVFMKTGSFRTQFRTGEADVYQAGFIHNSPFLDNPVIFARDLGPATNALLIAKFPDRKPYWINLKDKVPRIVPYEQVRTLPQEQELPPGVPVPATSTSPS